jgi:hypothetical protein
MHADKIKLRSLFAMLDFSGDVGVSFKGFSET